MKYFLLGVVMENLYAVYKHIQELKAAARKQPFRVLFPYELVETQIDHLLDIDMFDSEVELSKALDEFIPKIKESVKKAVGQYLSSIGEKADNDGIQAYIDKTSSLSSFYRQDKAEIKQKFLEFYQKQKAQKEAYSKPILNFTYALAALEQLKKDSGEDPAVSTETKEKLADLAGKLDALRNFSHTGNTNAALRQEYDAQFRALLESVAKLHGSTFGIVRVFMGQLSEFLNTNKYIPFFNAYLKHGLLTPKLLGIGLNDLEKPYVEYIKGAGARQWHQMNFKKLSELLSDSKETLEERILSALLEAEDNYGEISESVLSEIFYKFHQTLKNVFSRKLNNIADLAAITDIIEQLKTILDALDKPGNVVKREDVSTIAFMRALIDPLQTVKAQRENQYLMLPERIRVLLDVSQLGAQKVHMEQLRDYFSNGRAIATYLQHLQVSRKNLAEQGTVLVKKIQQDTPFALKPKSAPMVGKPALQKELAAVQHQIRLAEKVRGFVESYIAVLEKKSANDVVESDFTLPEDLSLVDVIKNCNALFNTLEHVSEEAVDLEDRSRVEDDVSLNFTKAQLEGILRKIKASQLPALQAEEEVLKKLMRQLDQFESIKKQISEKDSQLLKFPGVIGSDFEVIQKLIFVSEKDVEGKKYRDLLKSFEEDQAYHAGLEGVAKNAAEKARAVSEVVKTVAALEINYQTLMEEGKNIESNQTSEILERLDKIILDRKDLLAKPVINQTAAPELESVSSYKKGFRLTYSPSFYFRGEQLTHIAKFLGVSVSSGKDIGSVLDSLQQQQNLPGYKKELIDIVQKFLLQKIDEVGFYAELSAYVVKHAPASGLIDKLRSYYNADTQTRAKYWNLGQLEDFLTEFREQFAKNRDQHVTALARSDKQEAIKFLKECRARISDLQTKIAASVSVEQEADKSSEELVPKSHKAVNALDKSSLLDKQGFLKHALVRDSARVELDVAAEKKEQEARPAGPKGSRT